jgi:hypothetical protein
MILRRGIRIVLDADDRRAISKWSRRRFLACAAAVAIAVVVIFLQQGPTAPDASKVVQSIARNQ